VADGIAADGLSEHFQASHVRSKRQRLRGFESAPPIGTKAITEKIHGNKTNTMHTLTTSCVTSIIPKEFI